MADKEQKVIPFQSGKNDSSKKPNKPKNYKKKSVLVTLGWSLGIALLVVLSLTFILPTTIFSSSGNKAYTFGKYDGKKIELEYGNYFYNSLNNYWNMYSSIFGGQIPEGLEYSIYYQAFQQSAIFTALSSLASKAKISPSESAITEALLESGFWNNEDGVFDRDSYNTATDFQKQNVRNYSAMLLPVTLVTSDITSAKISKDEVSFIEELNNSGASFEYLVVDSTLYPVEEAIKYAESNPLPFTSISLSLLSYENEESAVKALENLKNGSIKFEEEIINSKDPYSTSNGNMGEVEFFVLSSLLSQNAGGAEEVFNSDEGSFLGPYETPYGFSIIRVDSALIPPNFSNPALTGLVRTYLSNNNPLILENYLSNLSKEIYQEALNSFEEAEEKYDLMVGTVEGVVQNPSSSSYINSLNSSDRLNFLTPATEENPELMNKLLSSAIYELQEPSKAGDAYIIIRRVDPKSENTNKEYSEKYRIEAGEISLSDFEDSVLTSPKFENNFSEVYQKATSRIN